VGRTIDDGIVVGLRNICGAAGAAACWKLAAIASRNTFASNA
jgi:hypothetical protein